MPGIDKLPLEDALNNSPQTRSLLSVFEQDTQTLRQYVYALEDCCQRILLAQHELTAATRNLANHLRSYEKAIFPLEDDGDSILTATLKQFANTIEEISSWHHILATQLNDGMMFPLKRIIGTDFQELTTMGELHKSTSNDLEKSYIRYARISKKKDTEQERLDAGEEIYRSRKKYHQMALHYFTKLNLLQYSRKTALIEPLLAYIQAMKSAFGLGHAALNTQDMEDFLNNISASVQGVHSERGKEAQETVDLIDSIMTQSQTLYHAETPPDQPEKPPVTTLSFKEGYLFYKTKVMGLMSNWEWSYFFTEGGNLMMVKAGDLAGSLVMELDYSTTAVLLEQEDRRSVFQINSQKKTVVLQALNDHERDEWISTIQNIVKKGGYVKDITKSPSSLFSGMGKFFAGKFHAASEAMHHPESVSISSVTSESKSTSKSAASVSPAPSPVESLLPDTPIVFDLISPGEEEKLSKDAKDGRPVRINPFDVSSEAISAESLKDASCFSEVYTVRFLGSMEVKNDRGHQLVSEIIRQIMAARAIHNIFKATELQLVINTQTVRLVDPTNQVIRVQYNLGDVSYWASHKENNRLFGFITRFQQDSSNPSYSCHVFEANTSGEEICKALSSAANIAYQELVEKKANKKHKEDEKQLLLDNIKLQKDKDDSPYVTSDGQFLVLDQTDPASLTGTEHLPDRETDHDMPRLRGESDA